MDVESALCADVEPQARPYTKLRHYPLLDSSYPKLGVESRDSGLRQFMLPLNLLIPKTLRFDEFGRLATSAAF